MNCRPALENPGLDSRESEEPKRSVEASNESVPLFVDLDGTLLQTDLLFESLLSGVKRDPALLLKLPGWLLKGRAYLKRRIAERCDIDVSTLPYREPLCEFLRAEAANGRSIYLATASDRLLAEAVAGHLGFFSGVLASDGANNLKGKRKLAAIQAMTNGAPFEYAGNGSEDLEIWTAAHGAIVVAAPPAVAAAAEELGNVREHFRHVARRTGALLRALRPQQWLKNLLVFVALLTSLSFGQATAWLQAGLAFAAFCLVASGIYIVNDLLDLRADRAHPRKRQRPFAAAQLSPQAGLLTSVILVVVGLVLGALLPWPTLLWLTGYLALTLLYSLVLKAYVLMDVVVLAGLYTLRVVVGAAAIEVPISFWLLAFSVFMFFSLALVKRCAEINLIAPERRGAAVRPEWRGLTIPGRDYRFSDEPTLRTLGIASGIASVAVFALYINAPENVARFGSPQVLWLVCPLLLYWIARMWIMTSRDEMHDDPLVFTLRDRDSRVVIATICGVFVVAALW